VKIQQAVKTETAHIAIGVLVGDVIMLAVFAALKRLDYTVLLGTMLGSGFAVLSFFLLGLTAQKVTESNMTPTGAARYMKSCYNLRMLMMLAVIVVGVLVPCFHYVAVIIPFLMPSAAAVVWQRIYQKREKDEKKEMPPNGGAENELPTERGDSGI